MFPQGDMEGALADYTVLAEMHPETPQLAKIVTELEAACVARARAGHAQGNETR